LASLYETTDRSLRTIAGSSADCSPSVGMSRSDSGSSGYIAGLAVRRGLPWRGGGIGLLRLGVTVAPNQSDNECLHLGSPCGSGSRCGGGMDCSGSRHTSGRDREARA
jgi:hypothetical protein